MENKYQPLHHKYRPYTFNELVGQEAITTTLQQALKTTRIAPAYLFSGPRGTGKTSSARILARSLNCLKNDLPTTNPCGKCSLCQAITAGNALDVIEIDAASNTGVDNIRELIEKSRFAPVQARWKIYVIDECHMLSTAAFNALLKTLEEPPDQVVFILATTDPQRVIPTILSRCQRFDFRRIPIEKLEKHLSDIAEKENITVESKALKLIAQRAQGGLRDAESMLDQLSLMPPPITIGSVWQLLGAVSEEELLSLASALIAKNPISLLENCQKIIDSGKEPIAILQGLGSILRDLIIKNVAPNNYELCNISNDSQQQLKEIANQAQLDQLLNWQRQLKGAEAQIKNSMQPRLWLEIQLLGMLNNNGEISQSKRSNKSEQNQIKGSTKKNEFKIHNNNQIQEETKKPEVQTLIKEKNEEKVGFSNEWELIISQLELPSTKMLLSQQASLINLSAEIAEVQVSSNWISMIQSRKNLIEEAIEKAMGGPRKLILKSHSEESNPIKEKEKAAKPENPGQVNRLHKTTESNNGIATEVAIERQKESVKDDSPQLNKSKHLDSLESKAKNLANFFNGEIIELDK